MTIRNRSATLAAMLALATALVAGCSIQDASQPPVGSVSVDRADPPAPLKAIKKIGTRRG